MASYVEAADLASGASDQRLAEYTAESGSTADAAVLATVLEQVCVEIDSYLAGIYVVPVTDTVSKAILKPKAVALAKFALIGRRDLSEGKDDPARVAYDKTIRWLEAVQLGKAFLPPTATRAAVPGQLSADLEVRVGSETPVFDPPSEDEEDW